MIFAGCGQFLYHASRKTLDDFPASAPGNQYYYYTAAQFQKNNGNPEASIALMKKAIEKDQESSYLKMELALLYLQLGDYQLALPVAEKIIEKEPEHVEALIMIGSIHQHKKQFAKAEEAYEKVIDLDPARERIFLILGSLYMDEKRWDDARKVYRRMVDHFPKSYFGYYFLGKAELEKGNDKAAEAEFKKSIEIEPKLLVPRFDLLTLYKKRVFSAIHKDDFVLTETDRKETVKQLVKKRYTAAPPELEQIIVLFNPSITDLKVLPAGTKLRLPKRELVSEKRDTLTHIKNVIDTYGEILKLSPDDNRAAIELGLFYEKIGIREKAESLFEEVGRASTTDRSVADTIIFLFYETKEFDDAIVVLEGMLKGAPNSSDLHYLAGSAFDGLDQKDRAIEHFRQVESESRFYENAVIQIAYLYQAQKKIDQAIRHMENVVQQVPENPEFLLYLGAFYEETEAYEKSEAVLKKALALNADNARVRFRLGVVYDKWGKKEASIDEMKKVIAINPLDAHALNYLGYTYLDLDRNLDEAEKLIRKAMELEPEDGYITDSLGWLYYKQGKFEKALELLTRAIELVKDDPIILEHLGDTNLKLGDPQKALEFYRRALEKKESDTAPLQKKIEALTEPDAVRPK